MTSLAPARSAGDAPARDAAPDLSFLLDHTSHVLRTRMSAALGEIGMTARMHCVLVKAAEQERTQAQIAELGDMDKTTMVVTVDALEQAGLAERRPSPTDRRARIIVVTPAGAAMAARSQEIVDRVHREALESLPEPTRTVLLDALGALAAGHLSVPDDASAGVRRARQ
ncbi:MarR family transcriptional regulator [Actinospica durhamensis]|uniref:MarR family transcriptional regulator n=1 Tax=Actinospica durhamensis TaxID=1508375 RepID=A0A941EPN3_9ACTN|nr:MarR family transcriptional regulator [Actinospica durhamensis]MBR7834861.1 MarR family transcriptional regulator [Actinospica durhamensis]